MSFASETRSNSERTIFVTRQRSFHNARKLFYVTPAQKLNVTQKKPAAFKATGERNFFKHRFNAVSVCYPRDIAYGSDSASAQQNSRLSP